MSLEEYCDRSGPDLPIDKFQGEQNSKSDIFYQSSYDVDTTMVATTVNWELGDTGLLKSITAYRNTEQLADEDLDGMEAVVIGRLAGQNNDTDQYSQEFQFLPRLRSSRSGEALRGHHTQANLTLTLWVIIRDDQATLSSFCRDMLLVFLQHTESNME